MKKILFVFILVAILAAGTAFASPVHPNGLGIGALWGASIGDIHHIGHHAALSLHIPNLPVFWGISWYGNAFGVQGDVYIIGTQLLPFMGWFFGIGGYGRVYHGNETALNLGVRFPIGLTFQFANFVEVFLNFAPNLGLSLYTNRKNDPLHFPDWGGYPLELGLRFWIGK